MIVLVSSIFFLLIGVGSTFLIMRKRSDRVIQTECTVLLEKIKPVLKLVTVEGHFSEIYTHRDNKKVFFGTINQSKKAIIIVKAKVTVGVDLAKAIIDMDNKNRIIKILQLPQVEILSIDPEIKYYDIDDSFFNRFNASDHTEINLKAKELIQEEVSKSTLPAFAEKQAIELINVIESSIKCFGWNLITNHNNLDQN